MLNEGVLAIHIDRGRGLALLCHHEFLWFVSGVQVHTRCFLLDFHGTTLRACRLPESLELEVDFCVINLKSALVKQILLLLLLLLSQCLLL